MRNEHLSTEIKLVPWKASKSKQLHLFWNDRQQTQDRLKVEAFL